LLWPDPAIATNVGDVLALAQQPIRLRELAHDLLRRVPLPRCHVLVEPSCPQRGRQDSHSTWINQPGSGQSHNDRLTGVGKAQNGCRPRRRWRYSHSWPRSMRTSWKPVPVTVAVFSSSCTALPGLAGSQRTSMSSPRGATTALPWTDSDRSRTGSPSVRASSPGRTRTGSRDKPENRRVEDRTQHGEQAHVLVGFPHRDRLTGHLERPRSSRQRSCCRPMVPRTCTLRANHDQLMNVRTLTASRKPCGESTTCGVQAARSLCADEYAVCAATRQATCRPRMDHGA
jgi:hypothetical protein